MRRGALRSGTYDGIDYAGALFWSLAQNLYLRESEYDDRLVRIVSHPLGFAPSWWPRCEVERRIMLIYELEMVERVEADEVFAHGGPC